ncbi:MAG: cell division ATPase MinD [Nanoarchaeota archaeon]|nr:cell division ATPase MinD [Nanoarchaeota archaeon]MBU1031203.1 cell division ATPase MinD [Nanoarchaeota archaeon]MBU1850335.1 cell division ATPase MinD [Nanoarchaeota archaeon]
MARFICVSSGKGGVGKTTTAINLALSMHNLGKDILLVDGNLTTPNIHLHLGKKNLEKSFYDVIKGKIHFSEAIHQHESGLKILPTTVTIDDLKNLNFDAFRESIINLQNYSDIVMLDSAASLGEEAISAIEAAHEILIVTNPEISAVEEARKTIKIAEELNKTILGVVINKKQYKNHELSEKEIAFILNRPIIATIPFDKMIAVAQKKNHPVVHSYPKSSASIQFRKLAEKIS